MNYQMSGLLLALVFLLAPNGPPVSAADLSRFHWDRSQAFDNWRFGCAHVTWLDANRFHVSDEWYADALWCRRCWDLLDDCLRVHPRDDALITCKLAELYRLLGREDFMAGRMPPAGPIWHFRDRY